MGCGAGEGAVRTAGGAGRRDLGREGGGADVPGSSSPNPSLLAGHLKECPPLDLFDPP